MTVTDINFFVPGNPVPKQSFRYAAGRGYTAPLIKDWQNLVAEYARLAYRDDPLSSDIAVTLIFYLPTKRRKDWDNLSKCVIDALNGIVYHDDSQIIDAHVIKRFAPSYDGQYGVSISVSAV